MADYTALVEAGSALVELLRDNLTPEPISNRELIALCSPHESENNQLTLYLYQVEEDTQGVQSGYYQVGQNVERMRPTRYNLRFLVTAHSKAPAQLRQADQYRMVGAALQVLKDHPVIDRQYLSGSLAEQNAVVRVVLEKTTQDQLLKIWNNTSTTYKLSFVVLLTGVEIESRRERRFSRVTDVAITTDQSFGVAQYTANGSQSYGQYVTYRSFRAVLPKAGSQLVAFNSSFDFGTTFPNTPIDRSVTLINMGTDAADFVTTVESDGESFTSADGMGSVGGQDTASVTFRFSAAEPGEYEGIAMIEYENAAGSAEPILMQLGGVVEPFPDYSGIVKGGDFEFSTGVDYPFAMQTLDDGTAVAQAPV